jgi:hypothetical protein
MAASTQSWGNERRATLARRLFGAVVLVGLCSGVAAQAGETPSTAPAALPEGDRGLAIKYPGDEGIGKDPAVLFHDDFESGEPQSKWDEVPNAFNTRIAEEPANVHGGKRALEMKLKKQPDEAGTAARKRLGDGHDVVFLRYYSKFDRGFDQLGSSHNGGYLAAIGAGVPEFTPGTKVTGRDKFMVLLENWRGETQTRSPGHLNIYCYHPEQRDGYGDHFFPTGVVSPYTYRPGDFGAQFVSRPDIIPDLDRWYCYEFMVKANTPGQRDGRIAFWVDGKLVADFPNMRLRDVDTLRINVASVGLHIKNNTIRDNTKWYDDVVIATSYIGPMVKKK